MKVSASVQYTLTAAKRKTFVVAASIALLNLSMKSIKEDETITSRKGYKQRREKGKKKSCQIGTSRRAKAPERMNHRDILELDDPPQYSKFQPVNNAPLKLDLP